MKNAKTTTAPSWKGRKAKNRYKLLEDGKHAVVYIRCKGQERATLISADDLNRVKEIPTTWYGVVRHCTMYVQACYGKPLKYVYMHRYIMGAEPDDYVDHADNDGMNNTRENLSIVSAKENNDNRRLYGTWDRLTVTAFRWYETDLGTPGTTFTTDENGYMVTDDEPLPWEA